MNDFEVLTSSNSNEWYTPPYIIEAARRLMGGIDIDPASNPIAQSWIKAKVYYRKEQDGFTRQWRGSLFLNPPYGRVNSKKGNYGAGKWFQRAYHLYLEGSVTEGLCLGRGDSEGIQLLTRECYYVECRRINFYNELGEESNSAVPGIRIFYLGTNPRGFYDIFSEFGTVVRSPRREDIPVFDERKSVHTTASLKLW